MTAAKTARSLCADPPELLRLSKPTQGGAVTTVAVPDGGLSFERLSPPHVDDPTFSSVFG